MCTSRFGAHTRVLGGISVRESEIFKKTEKKKRIKSSTITLARGVGRLSVVLVLEN